MKEKTTNQNITQKPQLLAYKVNDKIFQSTFDFTDEALLIMDEATGKIVMVNKSACSLYGYNSRQFTKKFFYELQVNKNKKSSHLKKNGDVFKVKIQKKIITIKNKKFYLLKILPISTPNVQREGSILHPNILSLIESSLDPIFVLQNFRLTAVNSAWKKLFGYSDKELKSKNFNLFNLAATDYKKFLKEKISSVSSNQAPNSHFEVECFNKEGKKILLEVSISPSTWNGKTALYGSCRDITERKEVENALKREAFIFDNLYDAVIITDLEGKILNWNNSAEQMYGYKKEEVINSYSDLLNEPGEGAKITKEILTAVKENGSWIGEIKFRRKNGSTGISETVVFPFKDNHGDEIALVGVNRDISTRKISEYELRQSEERYRNLFNASPISLWEEDFSEVKIFIDELAKSGVKDFRKYFNNHVEDVIFCAQKVNILDVNLATLNLYQANEKKEILTKLNQFLNDDGLNQFKEGLIKLCEGKNYFEVEGKNVTLQGKLIEVSIKASIVPGYEKTWSKVLVSIIDITKRKMAENAAIESQNRYKEITDLLPQTVFEINLDGVLTFANQAAFKTFNYTRDDFEKGLLVYDLLVPKDRGRAAANMIKVMKGEKSGPTEYLALRKDGSTFPVIIFSTPILKEGKPAGWRGILIDITERKETEDQLLKLSRAVEQSPASIIITDIFGNIQYVNPRFTELTGYTYEEVIGKNPSIQKSGQTAKWVYEELWNTITSGQKWRGEFYNKKKSGELYWEYASISPVVNSDGKITHFLAIKEDITQKKMIEKELIRAKEKAEESDRLKSEFLAQMSHEIRSPLNIIMSYSSFLQEELYSSLKEEYKAIFSSIDSAGKRLLRTMDLILNMSAIHSGYIDIKPAKVNLTKIISGIIKELEFQAVNKNLLLNFKTHGKPGYILADDYIVSEIFQNLIGNAIKFTTHGKVEVLIYENENNKLCVDVKDTGIGISESYMPKLFSPFSQEETGYSRKFDGNGLGLALVKNYCELLDAKIEVQSKKGIGSTFKVMFKRYDN